MELRFASKIKKEQFSFSGTCPQRFYKEIQANRVRHRMECIISAVKPVGHESYLWDSAWLGN